MRLFVGGVDTLVSAGDLQDVFEKYGTVDKVETGFSGFAFVTMNNDDEATIAMKALDNTNSIGPNKINVQGSSDLGYMAALSYVLIISSPLA
jgi:RNA recognition motif-containing protein